MGRPGSLDWGWALRSGGNLSRREKLLLVAPIARAVLRYPGGRLRIALRHHGGGRIDLDALAWPDSKLARDAIEVAETLTPHVLEHSYRTWIFGKLLAQLDGVTVDDELTFVSSMLHDGTLETRTPGRCFAVVGAERARQFALDRDVPPERAEAIGAAVAGHITPGALEDLSDPAGFVSAGAFLDLTGFGCDRVARDWLDEVHRRHPRHQLLRHVRTALREEKRVVPDGRIRWLLRYGGFGMLLALSPHRE